VMKDGVVFKAPPSSQSERAGGAGSTSTH